jgi:Outer membrane receptor for ferrienterochelin and colicins
MIQKILTIVLILAAVVGMYLIIRRQRRADCSGGCNGCPLASTCSKAIVLLALLALSLPVSAHLHGIVYDDQGEPLAGANVWWAGTTEGATTDEQGIFEIELVRETKLLVTSFLGYRNDTTRVKDRSTLVIVLIPDNQQLDEVTVEARRQSVIRSRFSAFDTESFGQAELCRAACCNLSESFETSASVDVAYADAATGAKQIRLLGLSGTYVQLLTENTPAVRGLAQSFGMEYIPGSWMDAVQISKGTSSVINGYEAITGQINVEYLKPQTQQPLAVNLMLNTDLHAEVNLTGGWDIPIPDDPMLGTLSTCVLAHYHEGAWPMDGNHDGMIDMPMDRILNILNRWYYRNDEYTFQFLIRGLHDARHGGQRETAMGRRMGITPPANPYLIDLRTDRVEGFMKNGFMFDEESGMSLGIIAAGSYHDQDNHYGRTAWRASQANGYLNAIFQNTWTDIARPYNLQGEREEHELSHKLSAGASVNYDQYWETLTGKALDPALASMVAPDGSVVFDRRELTPGVFAEYTFDYEKKFSLIAGLRGDYSTRYGFFVTPRMNLRYAPFEWWTIRGSIGLGYRSPNVIADNASALLTSTREWHPDYGVSMAGGVPYFLSAHQERSLNAGLTTVFDIPIGKRNLQISAEYYYTRFFDALVVDYDASPGEIWFYNLSDLPDGRSFSHTAQIEASMEVLRGWTITAAFRYNDVRQTSFHTMPGIATLGQYELREKALQNRFKGLVTMSYVTPLKHWQFDVTAQFNGPGRMPDGVVADHYQMLGGNMNYPRLTADGQYYERNGSIYHKWYPQLLAQVTKYWRTCSLYVGAENMTNFTQDKPIAGTYNADGQVIMDYSLPFDASMIWAPTTGWRIYAGFRWALDRPED